MSKEVILTGLRANNDLHIGNYFGALLPIIDMAKKHAGEYQINLFVPDLHSFTTPIDHSQLQAQIKNNLRIFAAAGLPLDNPDVHLYRQSYVPAHSEMTWILDCFTGMGEMERMTQFKDKSGNSSLFSANSVFLTRPIEAKVNNEQKIVFTIEEFEDILKKMQDNNSRKNDVSMGLLNYPVLMAADILLYGSNYVPVGEDQTQHLEITRDIAERMNSKFGQDLFTVPYPVKKQHEFFGKDQGLRIKDLLDPSKKMSKSDDSGKGVIFLGDKPQDAAKKIMSAATDDKAMVNYDKVNQPGISNLIEILTLLRGRTPLEVADEFKGETRYGEFKKVVAKEMQTFLEDFQSKLAAVKDEDIERKLKDSEDKMNEIANSTLLKVQKAVGLR